MSSEDTDNPVASALDRAVKLGENHDWNLAVESAPLPQLVTALAERLITCGGNERVILQNLTQLAVSRRPAIYARVRKEQRGPRRNDSHFVGALRELQGYLDALPGQDRALQAKRKISQRIESRCELLGIAGRVRQDLLNLDMDETLLEGLEIEELLEVPLTQAKVLWEALLQRASPEKRPRPPAARRARLALHAAIVMLLTEAPEDRVRWIRNALGSYCCRQAQSFMEDRNEVDVAQDYALEAAGVQAENKEFPVSLFLQISKIALLRERGSEKVPPFLVDVTPEKLLSEDLDARILTGIGFALLRLAEVLPDEASRCFRLLKPGAARLFLETVGNALDKEASKGATVEAFQDLAHEFNVRRSALRNLLRQAVEVESLGQVAALSSDFEQLVRTADALLWRREHNGLRGVVLAAARIQQAHTSVDITARRGLLRAANKHLDDGVAESRDLSFGLLFVTPLSKRWSPLLEGAISATTDQIKPRLVAELYRRTFSRRGEQAFVELQVKNEGPGVATAIDGSASWHSAVLTQTFEKNTLNPGEETLFTVSGSLGASVSRADLMITLGCRDVEGNSVYFPPIHLVVEGAPPDFDFEEKRRANPFNAGEVVRDPAMFMGREAVLNDLSGVVTARNHHGALRLLYGQRRVGKSSILYFLDQRLETIDRVPVFCASVTWLSFSRHRPLDVVYELARATVKSAARHGITLPSPVLAQYQSSYSVEFNRVCDSLLSSVPDSRLAILVDEFDKSYYQLTNPDLGFDEEFYSYLRSLTLTDRITLVVAGGEELPSLVAALGPTFNNARRIRASYLKKPDVTQLVRNPYVTWLDFSDPTVDRIYRLTSGNPFFTQIVCEELVIQACNERSLQVTTRDVEAIARRLVCETLATEQVSHLYQIGGKHDAIEMAIIYHLSRGQDIYAASMVSDVDLTRTIRADGGAVRQALNRLIEREVVRNVPESPSHVQLMMPLFGAWFREHCPLDDDAWALIDGERPGTVQ